MEYVILLCLILITLQIDSFKVDLDIPSFKGWGIQSFIKKLQYGDDLPSKTTGGKE